MTTAPAGGGAAEAGAVDVEAAVLVVGAGPVGLLLAGDLAERGVDVVVADRLSAPMTESRASQLGARTMEVLAQRGVLADFGDELVPEPRGHFAGLSFDASAVPSPYPGHWKVPQFRTEAVLARRALAAGARLLRGHELDELSDDGAGVVARFRTDGGPRTVRAEYAVGCDGGHSTVRSLVGFPVETGPARRELLRADLTGVEVPDRRFQLLERGFAASARRPDGVTRVMVRVAGAPPVTRQGPPSLREIAAAWRTVTGEDIGGAVPLWRDAFDDSWVQAAAYRRGRVLLAGDAAHAHMPVGGQSLNTGLQDAANLGWKLAAQVQGWAPPGLLDSYHDERHPIGRRVLDNVQAQGLLLFGGAETAPVRQVLARVLADPGPRDRIAAWVTGLDVRYDVRRDARGDDPADTFDGVDAAPLLGSRVPDLALTCSTGERTAVHALLRDGRGLLLDLAPEPASTAADADGWADRVRTVRATAGSDGAPFASVLVRPDGHVVWTDRTTTPLRTALTDWFGTADPGGPRQH
ncbi:FAD-dependent monooxygenase [Streptomyces sp. NPDC020412]|uniref:FAD-dependent monooxygenase n=1 Tax=Streptomyces sp. NPDC020412 TaxID=3365073 RepID=UPI0037AE8432